MCITADHRTSGYRGFYIQTEGSGSAAFTPGASDGIFVFVSTPRPCNGIAIGDKVRVTGA